MVCSIMKRFKTAITLVFATSMFFFLLCFPSTVVSVSFNKIPLPANATGPEAVAFEPRTNIFWTGVADGRIFKYIPAIGFVYYGTAAPNRSKTVCDGTPTANPNPMCGRALGLAFHSGTNQLYVCDAFFGLGVLGPRGGLAKIISTSAEGVPYRFVNAIDVHQQTGDVYFTDASAVYDIRQLTEAAMANDSTGRLLKYDIKKKEVTVLYRNLSLAVGVAIDKEAKFALVTEFIANRTRKIWLQPPKANRTQLINFNPMPDNIRRTESGSFWLAATMVKPGTQSVVPVGLRIDPSGTTVSETVSFEKWYGNKSISEVKEVGDNLYVASRLVDFIGVYQH